MGSTPERTAGARQFPEQQLRVVLAEGAEGTERELIDHCRDRLAHYKCPTSVDFRDELARTATGKLQKYKLRSAYWEDMERQIN